MVERDPTFRHFTAEQGKAYAVNRGVNYPNQLFDEILKYHKSNGNGTAIAVDVGCGPGNATRSVAMYFDRVIGLDRSQGMIDAARYVVPDEIKSKVSFDVCPAEDIATSAGIKESSVNMITVAVAIHWFDLPAFYAAASRILVPGGTIAVWAVAPPQVCSTFPKCDKINGIFNDLAEAFNPYKMPGNILVEGIYQDLPLPWSIDPQNKDFDESSFVRKIFSEANCNALLPSYPMTFTQLEQAFASASPNIRWREAHPQLVGTDKDIIKAHFARIKEHIEPGMETLQMAVSLGLLMFKKKTQV